MRMAVDKARNDGLPFQIDHARCRAGMDCDLGVGAYRGDTFARDGDGLVNRRSVVERNDLAALQDHISR